MKKIAFLDIDGVLNIAAGPNATYKTTLDHFDSTLIKNMNSLFSKFEDIDIILSSDWRKDLPDTKNLLEEANFLHVHKIIDITPIDKSLSFRGEEIAYWLSKNNFEGKFLCIDDNIEPIEMFIDPKYCLSVDSEIGFDLEKLNAAISYFE